MVREINSLKNPRIKNLFQLKEKSKQRRAQGLFIIEGKREVLLAVNSGYTIKTIYFDPLLFDLQKLKQLENHQIEWVKINTKIYEKVALRGSKEVVLAVEQTKILNLY
jgi:TrmH family RNA methyltransferase